MVAKICGLVYQHVLDLMNSGKEQSAWIANWLGRILHVGFANDVMRSATAILVAVTAPIMNFPSVTLKITFINSQWGGLTYCGCVQKVSFFSSSSKLKPLLAVPSDHTPSEKIDDEKWPWWDFSTMSKLYRVWHASIAGNRTGISAELSLCLMVLISSFKCYLWKSVHTVRWKHWSFSTHWDNDSVLTWHFAGGSSRYRKSNI